MGTQKRKPNKKNKLIKGGTQNPLLPKDIVDLLNALFDDQNENEKEIIEILDNNIKIAINKEINFNKYFNDEYNNDDEYKKLRHHINSHTMNGDTTHLIILATQLSTIKVMEKLIDMRAKLEVKDNYGNDSMYYACMVEDDEKKDLLETYGLRREDCGVRGGKSRNKYKLKNKKIRRTTKRKTLKRKRNNKP
jgi:hypothetical protein